jgi:hypothetical protein
MLFSGKVFLSMGDTLFLTGPEGISGNGKIILQPNS